MRARTATILIAGTLTGISAASALGSAVRLNLPPDKLAQTAGFADWLFGRSWQEPPTGASPSLQDTDKNHTTGQEGPRKRQEHKEQKHQDEKANPPVDVGGTYRTLCVRLCDGFYFPISFATIRSKVREDAKRCERQCPSRSRLYFHRNPHQTVEDMVDLDGHPYTKLAQAFRFRETYVPDCTCRGNPWDADALAKHEAYVRNPPTTASLPPATVEKPKLAEPRRRSRQGSWGYRARQDHAVD